MKGFIRIKGNKVIAVAAAMMLTMSESFCVYRRKMDTDIVSAATGEYKTWKQSDSRWGDMLLGSSTDTMRQSGCATTALASLVVHAGFKDETDFDPGVFCSIISENNGYDKNGNIMWWTVSKAAKGFTFVDTVYMYGSTYEERVAEIKSYLDKGYYIIADVKYSGHWVAIDRIENGIVYSIDPASNTSSNLFEQYDFKGNTRLKLFDAYGKAGPLPEAPEPPKEEKTYEKGSYIITTTLNIRKGASSSTQKLGEFSAGTRAEVTEVSGCWGKITYKGETAWICLDYTVIVSQEPGETPEDLSRIGAYCTNDVLNFRENPGIIHKSYGLIPNGTKLNIYEVRDNWGRTRYNGQTGWICLDYADYLSHDFISEGIVTTPEVTTPAVETTVQLTTTSEVTTTPQLMTTPEETTTAVLTTTPEETTTVQLTTTPEVTTTIKLTAIPEATTVLSSVTSAVNTTESSDKELVSGFYRTVDALNLRTDAGTTNSIICVLPKNTEVFVEEVSGNWGRISYREKIGWICLDYAEKYDTPAVTSTTEASESVTGPTETSEASQTVIIITTAPVTSALPESSFALRGDVDEDGSVNILDFIRLKSIFADLEEGTEGADVNGDGVVTASDLLAWMKMYVR